MSNISGLSAQHHCVEVIDRNISQGDTTTARRHVAEYVERFGLEGHYGDQVRQYLHSLDAANAACRSEGGRQ